MMLKKVAIRVGTKAISRDAYPYSLPAGLADGVEVTVVSYDKQTYNHVVRDPEGREWTIQALQNLDAGDEYMIAGRWLPEDHPLVMAELQKSRFALVERVGGPSLN